jgi:predicted dehydrogenase
MVKRISEMSRIPVGLVGAGYIANFSHIPAYLHLKDANLVAICDENIIRGKQTAEKFGIPKVYTNLNQMLSVEHLELVDVCLPPQLHGKIVAQVLESGINCLVEKPLTVTTSDADKLISLAKTKNVKLFTIHNYSAVPSVLKAKQLVAEQKIGKVVGVHINNYVQPVKRYLEPTHWCHSLPGEYFSELGPHLSMLLVEFLGPVKQVKSTLTNVSGTKLLKYDELNIISHNQNGVGTISCSLNCPAFVLTLDIVGTEGLIHISGTYQAVVYYPATTTEASAFQRGIVGIKDILSRGRALTDSAVGVLIGKYSTYTLGHRYLIQQCIADLQGRGKYPIDTILARESINLLEMSFDK